ncbi:MAG: response regulator, partial [Deltaproteobacteria bacterium]|nr:response regulator [Deltaproteobacteria bacterium]
LAGSVVQDFSDLLSTVLGNAELALSTLPADSPARQDLERVVAAGERAGDLTRQLQSFAGRGSFLLEQVNLSELIARSERRLRGAVPQRCALRFDLAAALSAVQADPRQLLQVVLNLLTNAAEAIGARPGSIDLRTLAVHCDRDLLSKAAVGTEQPEGAYVALEVRDDGRGMAQHVLEQIFDPFFTTKSSGRGLGLPAVQGIVRAHHGVVMVETEPCHGSRFRVLLPAISRPATEVRGPSVASSATPCRVLVADDEELVCRTTQAILERAGYTVVVAPDGQKALEALRARGSEFALVLLALRKPGFGTREVLAKLRRLYPELPVLLSSGLPEADPARADLQTSFVAKPFTRAELLEAVQRAAGSPSSESSLTNPKGVV